MKQDKIVLRLSTVLLQRRNGAATTSRDTVGGAHCLKSRHVSNWLDISDTESDASVLLIHPARTHYLSSLAASISTAVPDVT